MKVSKKIIISLLQDDLKHIRQVLQLREIGLGTANRFLKIHESVFDLMGFNPQEINDELTEWYFRQTERTLLLKDTGLEMELRKLATEIHNMLCDRLHDLRSPLAQLHVLDSK